MQIRVSILTLSSKVAAHSIVYRLSSLMVYLVLDASTSILLNRQRRACRAKRAELSGRGETQRRERHRTLADPFGELRSSWDKWNTLRRSRWPCVMKDPHVLMMQ